MVNTTILFDGSKKTVDSEVAIAFCLNGNKEEDGVEVAVICVGERGKISPSDLVECLGQSMVDAVSGLAVGDSGAVLALMKLTSIVSEAAKKKCLERLSK